MHVCENTGDHLAGNVYARYKNEEDAQKAIEALNSRWYAARPVYAELSPVTDFKEADCRQRGEAKCNRGGMCNFMVKISIHSSSMLAWRTNGSM
jgi:splicing factor U2AF 35 kDa subunit